MNLQATKHRVILREIKQDTTTESGIYLQHRKEAFPDQGEVVAVGASVEGIAVGDTVIFQEGAFHKIRHKGEDLMAVHDEHCYAVVAP